MKQKRTAKLKSKPNSETTNIAVMSNKDNGVSTEASNNGSNSDEMPGLQERDREDNSDTDDSDDDESIYEDDDGTTQKITNNATVTVEYVTDDNDDNNIDYNTKSMFNTYNLCGYYSSNNTNSDDCDTEVNANDILKEMTNNERSDPDNIDKADKVSKHQIL